MGWVDMHSHVLPGLDDGAPDLETGLQMCAALHEVGFNVICATPHVSQTMWNGAPEEVVATARVLEDDLLERLRPPGNGGEVDVSIVTGGEHYLDAAFLQRLEEDRLLEYPRDRGVLVEVSLMPRVPHPGLRDIMFRIRVKGLMPVLAHPERYDASHRSLDWIEDLHNDGVGMLGDLLSLTGKSGRKSRRTLERMLDSGLIDGMCSDAHSIEDVHALERSLTRLEKLVGRDMLESLMTWGRTFTG